MFGYQQGGALVAQQFQDFCWCVWYSLELP
jgi:hypothetical protein